MIASPIPIPIVPAGIGYLKYRPFHLTIDAVNYTVTIAIFLPLHPELMYGSMSIVKASAGSLSTGDPVF